MLLLLSGMITLSCSQERPPNLPLVGIYNRTTAKIEVSEIVVKQPAQGARVKAVYLSIAQRVEALSVRRRISEMRLSETLGADHIDRALLDREVAQLKKDERAAFADYVKYQMELRKLLTEKEFEKLGKFEK